MGTNLSVLKLLFDIIDEAAASLANETTKKQFWPNLARTSYRTTDAHQGSYFVRS